MSAALEHLGLFGPLPAKTSLFLVTSCGDYNASVLVLGLAGLRNEVTAIFMGDAKTEPDEMCGGILETLADPEQWIEHGHSAGDGEPFWHIHFSFEDGRLDVQRVNRVQC